jgi:cytochrome c-type biogenesis protein CcmE
MMTPQSQRRLVIILALIIGLAMVLSLVALPRGV